MPFQLTQDHQHVIIFSLTLVCLILSAYMVSKSKKAEHFDYSLDTAQKLCEQQRQLITSYRPFENNQAVGDQAYQYCMDNYDANPAMGMPSAYYQAQF